MANVGKSYLDLSDMTRRVTVVRGRGRQDGAFARPWLYCPTGLAHDSIRNPKVDVITLLSMLYVLRLRPSGSSAPHATLYQSHPCCDVT